MQINGVEVEPGLSAKDGLLHLNGVMVPLPAADAMARKYKCLYAENLVHELQGTKPKEHGACKPEVKMIYALKRTWINENPSDELIQVPYNWDFSKAAWDQEDLFYVNLGSNQQVIEYEGPVPDKGPVFITETHECRDTDNCCTLGIEYHMTTATVTVYISPDHGDYESLDIRPTERPHTHNALIALMRAIEIDNRTKLNKENNNAKKIQRHTQADEISSAALAAKPGL